MIGRNVAGHMTFTADDREEVAYALKEIFQTDIGQTYKRDFYAPERGDDDLDKILRAAEMLAGGPNITVQFIERALQLLMDSGELQPRELASAQELAEPEKDPRPRDRNGKLLTPQQIAWSEYRQYAETHSSEECRQRARSDAGFASFMRKNLEREMGGGVGDAVIPVGDQGTQRVEPNATLVEFARKYHAESVINLRPKGGSVTLAGEQMPYQKFLDLVNKASAIRLI